MSLTKVCRLSASSSGTRQNLAKGAVDELRPPLLVQHDNAVLQVVDDRAQGRKLCRKICVAAIVVAGRSIGAQQLCAKAHRDFTSCCRRAVPQRRLSNIGTAPNRVADRENSTGRIARCLCARRLRPPRHAVHRLAADLIFAGAGNDEAGFLVKADGARIVGIDVEIETVRRNAFCFAHKR